MSKPIWCVRARERINRVPPSAERNERLHSSGFGERQSTTAPGSPVEDTAGLPSLPDLLDELETDSVVDLNALEQLTQTLLEDIARDLESAAQKAADQESAPNEKDLSGEMVGTPPEQLESSGSGVLGKEGTSVEQDISEYLLLHHNYAKTEKKPPPPPVTAPCRKARVNTKKFKLIRPKIKSTSTKSKIAVKTTKPFLQPENNNLPEDSIEFLVNADGTLLNEIIVVDDNITQSSDSSPLLFDPNLPIIIETNNNNSLSVPLLSEPSSSPRSDLGYESLDSPVSNSDLDNWDPCVSELFPSLF